MIADGERLFLLGNQAAGDLRGFIGAAIGQEQGEFVAAQTGQQVSRADEAAQALADRAQRAIADCLPQASLTRRKLSTSMHSRQTRSD